MKKCKHDVPMDITCFDCSEKEDKFTPENEHWECHRGYDRTGLNPDFWFIKDRTTGDEIAELKPSLHNERRDLRSTGIFIAQAPGLLEENRRLKEAIERAIMCLGIQFDDIYASEILKEAIK